MTRDEAIKRAGGAQLAARLACGGSLLPSVHDAHVADLLLAVEREGYDRGYAEAQLRLEESVLTRVATEARRKALEDAARICDRDGGSPCADWIRRELIAKGGADV